MNSKIITASVLALFAASCGSEDQTASDAPVSEAPSTATTATTPGVAHWVVSDEDSTIVLFPTIHFLPADLEWRSESVNQKLAEADEIWFEVLPSELMDQQLVQGLAMTYGMSPDRPLSERLDDATYARVADALADLGMPIEQMEPLRPWMVAVTIASMDLVRDGFDPSSGVEMVLSAETPDEKERGFETVEQQLSFFGGLSEDVEIAFLNSTLDDVEKGQEEIKEFANAWAVGELSTLEDLVIDSIRDVSEELYQVLITRRNKAWVDVLSAELDGAGTDFVAVGAAHLIGADGVPALLEARGYTVEGPLTE